MERVNDGLRAPWPGDAIPPTRIDTVPDVVMADKALQATAGTARGANG
jgi:hypothetical protein